MEFDGSGKFTGREEFVVENAMMNNYDANTWGSSANSSPQKSPGISFGNGENMNTFFILVAPKQLVVQRTQFTVKLIYFEDFELLLLHQKHQQ